MPIAAPEDPITDPILLNDWHPVLAASDLPADRPAAARLLGEDLVLWRSAGRPLAWRDLCIHRGAKLSLGKVAGDTLACPYHGWVYGAEGRCLRIPAHAQLAPPPRAQARTYRAQERFGVIWVCLGELARDLPDLPQWSDPAYRHDVCGPYTFQAAGPRVMENFFDVGHFAFVHDGLLGASAHPEVGDHHAVVTPDGITVDDVRVWQPGNASSTAGGEVTYRFQIHRPFTAEFLKSNGPVRILQRLIVTPVSRLLTQAWMLRAMNTGLDRPAADFRAFEDLLASQDVAVVESQRPELLPLDLQAELHLRSDRIAIAYRQWLRVLGLSYGTA
jgi:phenylpropionate dioxygenase-like ring-hydroxylating dioxygenase large terminal subunit